MRSGIARVARSLAKSFANQSAGRFEVIAAGPPQVLNEIGVRSWNGGRVRVVPWNEGRYAPLAEWSWQRVRREAGDAIWYFPHWDVPWLGAPERYVVTVNDLAHLQPGFVSPARRALARAWIRHALSRARCVTTASTFSKQALAAAWPEFAGKTEMLSYGIDAAFFGTAKELPQDVARSLGGSAYVLSVGNLKGHKNLAVGVDVLSRIESLHWVVVGEWFPDWSSVEDGARSAGVSSRIHLVGRVSDETLKALYDHSVCLLFPSTHEGFGFPILEALAGGTPVVTADAAASIETLGGAGTVCRSDDAACFARAVSDAMSAGRAAGAARRRERAAQFTWNASATGLARIVEAISAER